MTLSVDAFDDTFALRAACECAAAEVDSNRIHLLSARHAKNYAEQQVLEASRVVDERIHALNQAADTLKDLKRDLHRTELQRLSNERERIEQRLHLSKKPADMEITRVRIQSIESESVSPRPCRWW